MAASLNKAVCPHPAHGSDHHGAALGSSAAPPATNDWHCAWDYDGACASAASAASACADDGLEIGEETELPAVDRCHLQELSHMCALERPVGGPGGGGAMAAGPLLATKHALDDSSLLKWHLQPARSRQDADPAPGVRARGGAGAPGGAFKAAPSPLRISSSDIASLRREVLDLAARADAPAGATPAGGGGGPALPPGLDIPEDGPGMEPPGLPCHIVVERSLLSQMQADSDAGGSAAGSSTSAGAPSSSSECSRDIQTHGVDLGACVVDSEGHNPFWWASAGRTPRRRVSQGIDGHEFISGRGPDICSIVGGGATSSRLCAGSAVARSGCIAGKCIDLLADALAASADTAPPDDELTTVLLETKEQRIQWLLFLSDAVAKYHGRRLYAAHDVQAEPPGYAKPRVSPPPKIAGDTMRAGAGAPTGAGTAGHGAAHRDSTTQKC